MHNIRNRAVRLEIAYFLLRRRETKEKRLKAKEI
jgi:hypothetical protein